VFRDSVAIPSPVEMPTSSIRSAAHTVVELTKARLVTLVVATTAVGFVLSGTGPTYWPTFGWTVLGTALAAAGVMSLNQGIEWRHDALMERTRTRPVPSGAVSPRRAMVFGGLVSAAGIAVLALRVNALTAGLGAAVVVLYVLVYTPLKTRTTLCTLAGALCGAIPPMMGWSGATGHVGAGAWVLAALLFIWQIPHFLALAWLYREDYRRGGFRMLPSIDPNGTLTSRFAVLYTIALLPIGIVAMLTGLSGGVAAAGSLVAGTLLLLLGVQLERRRSDASARRLFLGTLAYLPLLLALMVADRAVAAGRTGGREAALTSAATASVLE
jgi:protoheme IX farnesyltransferase